MVVKESVTSIGEGKEVHAHGEFNTGVNLIVDVVKGEDVGGDSTMTGIKFSSDGTAVFEVGEDLDASVTATDHPVALKFAGSMERQALTQALRFVLNVLELPTD